MTDVPNRENLRKRRVAVFNDSAPTLSTMAKWLEIHGYGVVTAQLSQMRSVYLNAEAFIAINRPDVIVFDIAMPYESNWDFLEVLQLMPSVVGLPFVLTTANTAVLEQLVGPNTAMQIQGKPDDLNAMLRAIDAAVLRPGTPKA